jgi:hypothetical protein
MTADELATTSDLQVESKEKEVKETEGLFVHSNGLSCKQHALRDSVYR